MKRDLASGENIDVAEFVTPNISKLILDVKDIIVGRCLARPLENYQ
jgi:hypothetical protein